MCTYFYFYTCMHQWINIGPKKNPISEYIVRPKGLLEKEEEEFMSSLGREESH